ncbi:carboxylesterase family protein [Henriciella sp. AS95]|uniref:carboxylesterase/lipase family protein n=1 Tax=Henriciella sp. AS95 TaxID=3135782 RepID=UPI003180A1EA
MRRALSAGLLAAAATACSTSTVERTQVIDAVTEYGVVHGHPSDGARAWFAIPYAAAPVDDLRWEPPQHPQAWTGALNADQPGQPCAQPGYEEDGAFKVLGFEDCLTLNVYAPAETADKPLPVMVWIHGGGNYAGSAAEYDGSRLAAAQDVIVVTVNYRLGPFGWFHHEAMTTADDGSARTGQFALLDLIASLEWVEANIGAFGGDADNVTIFGESAGAQNVYALVLAKRAAGLFDKAIAESGGFWNMSLPQARNLTTETPPGTRASANEIIVDLLIQDGRADSRADATALIETMSQDDLLDWMRGLDTESILRPYADQHDLGYDLPSVVQDGVLLPKTDHRAHIASGDYNQVPMLIGSNRNEQKLWQAFDPSFVDWSSGAPDILDRNRYTAVDQHYSNLWTFDAVDDLAPRLDAPVFAYRFDWDEQPSQPVDWPFLMGSSHGLEIPFVFGTFEASGIEDIFNDDNEAGRLTLSDAMMSYWGAFAHTGDPGAGADSGLTDWPSWQTSQSKLIFDTGPLSIERVPDESREQLLDAALGDTRLTDADRCLILHHNSLYPSLDIKRLAEAGCEPAWAGE